MISFIILVIALVAVVYGAKYLVDGASALAQSYNIPNIVIGLTIVAFGTSAPELAISAYSAYTGNTEIAIGNVVGSNIFNIFFILGVCSIIYPLTILKNTVAKEIPLSLLAALVLYVMLNDGQFGTEPNLISLGDSIILLFFMIIFLFYMFHLAYTSNETEELDILKINKTQSILFILGGFILLIAGGKFFVDSAVDLARNLGMSEAIIGLTIVAAGTSLPELATSLVAAFKKNSDIAVGNIVGSNIFNIFFILGVSGLLSPLPQGNITNIDLMTCIGASVLLFLFCFIFGRDKITKPEGVIFILCYLVYVGYQISLVG